MTDLQQLSATSAQMFAERRDIEDALTYLRQNGCGKLDSIKILIKLKGMGLQDAKRVIHFIAICN